jgi:hypothetical protein
MEVLTPLLTEKQVADYLHHSVKWLRSQKSLICVKIGSTRFYEPADVAKYVQENKKSCASTNVPAVSSGGAKPVSTESQFTSALERQTMTRLAQRLPSSSPDESRSGLPVKSPTGC